MTMRLNILYVWDFHRSNKLVHTNWFIQTIGSWCSGNHTAQLDSTKSELRFCAGSNPAHAVSEIRDGEDLWQWSRLEIRLNAFRWSTIPQKQFIIIIIIIIMHTYEVSCSDISGIPKPECSVLHKVFKMPHRLI